MNTLNKKGLWASVIIIVILITLLVIWLMNRENDAIVAPVINTATTTQTTQDKLVTTEEKPGQSVAQIVASLDSISSFNSYFVSTGVSASVSGSGPYTIFAPTNEAFSHQETGSISGLSSADKKSLVQYHIISGRNLDVDALSFGQVTSMSKDVLNFDAATGVPQVNSAYILKAYKGTNGTVYVISEVLFPPTSNQ